MNMTLHNRLKHASAGDLSDTESASLRNHTLAGAGIGALALGAYKYMKSTKKNKLREILTGALEGGVLGAGAGAGVFGLRNTDTVKNWIDDGQDLDIVPPDDLTPYNRQGAIGAGAGGLATYGLSRLLGSDVNNAAVHGVLGAVAGGGAGFASKYLGTNAAVRDPGTVAIRGTLGEGDNQIQVMYGANNPDKVFAASTGKLIPSVSAKDVTPTQGYNQGQLEEETTQDEWGVDTIAGRGIAGAVTGTFAADIVRLAKRIAVTPGAGRKARATVDAAKLTTDPDFVAGASGGSKDPKIHIFEHSLKTQQDLDGHVDKARTTLQDASDVSTRTQGQYGVAPVGGAEVANAKIDLGRADSSAVMGRRTVNIAGADAIRPLRKIQVDASLGAPVKGKSRGVGAGIGAVIAALAPAIRGGVSHLLDSSNDTDPSLKTLGAND
jgi:hypothetical protein